VVCPGCNNLVGVRDERCFTCGRWNPGLWGFAPALSRLGRDLGFTPFVIGACVVLYALTLLFDPSSIRSGGFNFLAPSGLSLVVFGASGATPVFELGRWWTVLTAGWLHGNAIHILFNMMSIRNVAPIVADFYGASRMVIIYIVGSMTGFLASSMVGEYFPFIPLFRGGQLTVGASAGITALIGAVLYYGKRSGSRHVGDQAKTWIIGFLVMGAIVQVIDNTAHVGGLAGGYVVARILDPLHPERLDHLLIALGLPVVSGIALIASVLDAFF
jgi:rhomboid protease GluP